jgi:fatty-acyl-CoA synthase
MADSGNIYQDGLEQVAANYQPLTPLGFLERAAAVYPARIAVVHGDTRTNYADLYARCRRLAGALIGRGIGLGDTVAIMAPNVPAMLEAHYGVPMTGAVLNALNYRLDAETIAFILDHGEAKVLITDREFSPTIRAALELVKQRPLIIDIDDPVYDGDGGLLGEVDYEAFLGEGAPDTAWSPPADEWQAISLNYTSGTTGDPKGVVYHHRGAYLSALSNTISARLGDAPTYLWTLPMFHCNGWCFPWTLSVVAGTHICLRRVEAAEIYRAIAEHQVTHMCGAPIVMGLLINAADADKTPLDHAVEMITAAAPPPPAVIAAMEREGFNITHVYGLTETYGPAVINAWQDDWSDLDGDERARLKARQGVRYPALEALAVLDPDTLEPVPADGKTLGEVMMRGNLVMKGYLKNPTTTKASFEGGWFHSGDLGVMHPNGYVELKDRSKDIIISGGENISSIEVENILYKHPAVIEAAVVARPDEKWGETPCAFVTLRPDRQDTTEQDIIDFCKDNMAGFKVPKTVVFADLPKTSTGKVQKYALRQRVESLP